MAISWITSFKHANRHVRGDTNEAIIDVHGNTRIKKGELVFVNDVTGGIVNGTGGGKLTVDNYGFPAQCLRGVTSAGFYMMLLGVAMNESASGTTNKIRVATTGIFRFPIQKAAGQAVKPGYTVSATTIGVGAGELTGTSVSGVSVEVGPNVDNRVGLIGIAVGPIQSGASYVDTRLMVRRAGNSILATTL